MFYREKEEWYKQRQPMGQFMLKPKKVEEYHEDFNEVTQDLLNMPSSGHPFAADISKEMLRLCLVWIG